MGVNINVGRLLVFCTTSSVESGDFDFREVPSIPRIAFTGATLHHSPSSLPRSVQAKIYRFRALIFCLYPSVFDYQEKYGHSEVGIGHLHLCKLKKIMKKKKMKKKKKKKKGRKN
jgi:hypothetical protein